MLKVLSEDVRECYRQAEECSRQAKAVFNFELRRDFLDLAVRWLQPAVGQLATASQRST
jgi:hypothetical protein